MKPALLLGATHNSRWAPKGPLRRGLEPQCLGLGTPEPQRRTHRVTAPPPGPLGAPPVIQGGRTGRALQSPGDLRRQPAPKCLGPRSRSPTPSPRPPLCSPHSWQIGLNRLLGDNSNPRSAPEGISQGAWLPNARDWDPQAPAPDSHGRCDATGLLGVPPVFQGGRTGKPFRAPRDLRRTPAPKRLGPRSRSPAPSPRPAPPLVAQPVDWACRPPGC